ncbi:MAG TPA: acetate--CoA ligase [Legionellales bacterium]|nr:acetate--CoA ligase [Legionellales bacterium]
MDINTPSSFWAMIAQKYLYWHQPWEITQKGDFENLPIDWFVNGKTNASYNCIDRHLPDHAEKIAILWEGNETHQSQAISFQILHEKTCQMANLLKKLGIKKGQVVCIYLPMIPEAIYAILACSRIGAIHNVIFGGFSAEALESRIQDSQAQLVITTNISPRGDKRIAFKNNVDNALTTCPTVKNVLVIEHLKEKTSMQSPRDTWYHEHIDMMQKTCPVEWLDAQDPLFILYTSGSTGKPKGIVHAMGGYLTYVAYTFDIIFKPRPDKKHWCTADIGWITGHSYLIYGPLLNAATTVMYEGVPNYPNFSRYWQIIDKYQIENFYTAPTVLRSLRHEGEQWISPYSLKSLELIGTVGEPINPDVWTWYFETIGKKRCPVINTWWQTETGGALIYTSPDHLLASPGSAGLTMQGIEALIDEENLLYITKPWPGMMKTIFNDLQRFKNQYFAQPQKGYLTGDSAFLNEKNEYIITGRVDDVIKVSGHRLGSEELESAAISHPAVSESAVIGIPHSIKGEAIIVFAVAYPDIVISSQLTHDLKIHLRQKIGPVATPENVIWVPGLPKTRSGKVMRRLLRKIVLLDLDSLGDISTLANPDIIEKIVSILKGSTIEGTF